MDLDLYRNKLTALPLEIGQLKNLTVLDLRENSLNESAIAQLRTLLPGRKIEF